MYLRFFKLNPHVTLFILLEAIYNSPSKKKLAIYNSSKERDANMHVFLYI